jgi:uncharacterized protein (TIGR03437 family)
LLARLAVLPQDQIQHQAGFLARIDPSWSPPDTAAPLIREVRNGASLLRTETVSPGELVNLIGVNLTSDAQAPVVSIGGLPAKVVSSTGELVRIQAPLDLPVGPAALVLQRDEQASITYKVGVIPASPGLFTVKGDGVGLGLFYHASDMSAVTQVNPAKAGETLRVLGTGFGTAQPGVQVDLTSETVAGTGLAAGVYFVDFTLDTNLEPGVESLLVECNTSTSILQPGLVPDPVRCSGLS